MKFEDAKVGQKVKVIKTEWTTEFHLGKVGEIISIIETEHPEENYAAVAFFDTCNDSNLHEHFPFARPNGATGWWYCAFKELEPVHKVDTKGTNPKDLLGVKKVSISKFPAAGLIHGAHAMMDGARKYGPYNWRGNKVIASIYVDALLRHVTAWFDEHQEEAPDSGVHHLGHVEACCAILLDAQETGNLIDDRPVPGKAAEILERLAAKIKAKESTNGL